MAADFVSHDVLRRLTFFPRNRDFQSLIALAQQQLPNARDIVACLVPVPFSHAPFPLETPDSLGDFEIRRQVSK